ncbi:MAG: hypothetical protein Q7V58_09635 [Actinomycetota bacterium]|nr:hypothetical protein [Actinomycetota bacterium]
MRLNQRASEAPWAAWLVEFAEAGLARFGSPEAFMEALEEFNASSRLRA